MSDDPVLRVEHLRTHFVDRSGVAKAVNDLSFNVGRAETLAIVGESGSGKSVACLSLLRLIPSPPGRIVSGRAWFQGSDLLAMSEPDLRRIRGAKISMVFQEPMTSLNPVLTIGRQLREIFCLHEGASRREASRRAGRMLELVGISDAGRRLRQYPHELSGGMRQRVMIAMALACNPAVLIADEPTTALDVTIQAQILELMRDLAARFGAAIILVTHDLGVVAQMARRVIVMYAGRKVEEGSVEDVLLRPRHPYTSGLLRAIPRLHGPEPEFERLAEIAGMVPSLRNLPAGCAFAPRCSVALARCRIEQPSLEEKAPTHLAACWVAT